MFKTQQDIEDDFYNALKNSALVNAVNGKLYKKDLRPIDSKQEDITLIVTTIDSAQWQQGVITLLIYVNGIDLYQSQLVPDKKRIKELSTLTLSILDELKANMANYDGFNFFQAVTNDFDMEIEQWFISVKIGFRYLTI
jgi:hypothetical protein